MVEPTDRGAPPPPAAPPPQRDERGEPDEVALAAGLRARDERAIEAFLERYRHLLRHCIAQFVSDSTTKEDLFQELVTYVLERLDGDRFDPEKGSFGTWLYRVAWCRCVDLKRRENAGRRLPTVPATEMTREPADLSPTPEDFAGDSEVGTLVRQCLAELDREDAELLQLRHMGGMTLVDIAEARSQTLETVKYRLRRATEAFRRRLLAKRVTPELVP